MLQIYRRHYPPCRDKSRRYRRCACPIWVQGSLAGEWIKKSLGVTSWEAATDRVREWEAAGGIGQRRRVIPSIADAITKFLVDCEARELKPTSITKYRHFLEKQLLPFAEAARRTRLHQLDVDALREFRSSWKFKPSTQQKKLETLRGFFRFCASAGWLARNPAPAVKAAEGAPASRPCLSRMMNSTSYSTPVTTSAETANGSARCCCCCAIRLADWRRRRAETRTSLDGKVFLYTQKTGTPVRIPLPRPVCQALGVARRRGLFLLVRQECREVGHRRLASRYWRAAGKARQGEDTPTSTACATPLRLGCC